MKKGFVLLTLFSFICASEFTCKISPLDQTIKARMYSGGSWHRGCPVGFEQLSYLKLKYINFKDQEKIGEMVVNSKIAKRVCSVFRELYQAKYPIEKIKLISDYKANDDFSMRYNNTSAFNCRLMTGSKTKWSNHSYGLAIDINPLINPYISSIGIVSPKEAKKYASRVHKNDIPSDRAKLVKGDKAVEIFKKWGFSWGGDWKHIKDYQHFEFDLSDLNKPIKKSKPNIKQMFKAIKNEGLF